MSRAAHPVPPDGFDEAFVAGVLDDALAHDARVYGLSGLQGTGKSTLAAQLVAAADMRGLRAVALSLDAFYLDLPQRRRLARRVHPLLATRGPPGTHEVALACTTLDALRDGDSVTLPAFDKLGDRRLPRTRWRRVADVDLVVFEGWCLGTPPQDADALRVPVNALEREEDPDGRWRGFGNDALARDYPALWRRVDRLLFLQPPGFEVVPRWRWQQEQALQAREPSRPGMTRAQVERFVQHYERVSRHALRALPAIADVVVALDADRRPRPDPVRERV
ncbi:kinase [Luteimonas viscosa]|uniref:Kinase n=1 Tax=Luteimonas viscosa TaxID=1132694 RepID=A0A5D4XRU2_9GAMM|nr:kinase [Luteimonas viscosa]TYT25662.1 kinase [Luteimonas viscosa]